MVAFFLYPAIFSKVLNFMYLPRSTHVSHILELVRFPEFCIVWNNGDKLKIRNLLPTMWGNFLFFKLINISLRWIGSFLSNKKLAKKIGTASFNNSDDWKDRGPILTHLCAPLISGPNKYVTPKSTSEKIRNNPDILLKMSGSGWLTKIIRMNPATT